MTSFDYLQGPAALVVRDLLRAVAHVRDALATFTLSLAVLAAVHATGSRALRGALVREAALQRQADVRAGAIDRSRAEYAKLRALAQLDRQISLIVTSGDREAAVLAAVAERVPPRAWLLSATHRSDGFVLAGRAADLRAAAEVLARFGDGKLGSPDLLSTSAQDARKDGLVAFELHLLPSPPP